MVGTAACEGASTLIALGAEVGFCADRERPSVAQATRDRERRVCMEELETYDETSRRTARLLLLWHRVNAAESIVAARWQVFCGRFRGFQGSVELHFLEGATMVASGGALRFAAD